MYYNMHFFNYLLTMWYDSGSSYSSHMHLVLTIAFSLEFLTLLGRKVLWMVWEIYLEKGCWVGFQFHTCILYCRLWGFGGYWFTCGNLEEFKSFGPFGVLSYVQCLGHHNTHLLPRFSIHIVSSCFIPFIFWEGWKHLFTWWPKKLLNIV
jgi:hypothetical protein